MIFLYLTACLVWRFPEGIFEDCRPPVRLPEAYATASECMITGQQAAAAWMAEHPKVFFAGYACKPLEEPA
jgi:hypothetical protein